MTRGFCRELIAECTLEVAAYDQAARLDSDEFRCCGISSDFSLHSARSSPALLLTYGCIFKYICSASEKFALDIVRLDWGAICAL